MLCNEVFPVRIPDDQHSVQIVAVVICLLPQSVTKMPVSCHVHVIKLNLVMFSDAMTSHLKGIFPGNISHSAAGCRKKLVKTLEN